MKITFLGMIAVITAVVLILVATAYDWDGALAKAMSSDEPW
jgi:hypothetical protein